MTWVFFAEFIYLLYAGGESGYFLWGRGGSCKEMKNDIDNLYVLHSDLNRRPGKR